MSFSLFHGHSGVPVLMFHGLCERIPEYALFPGGRSCFMEVEAFSRFMSWCSKNFDILCLSDLDKYLIAGNKKLRPIILTFDDGLASVIDLALPILREYNASAVVFVTKEWTDSARTPDIFLLERVLWECIPTNLRINVNDHGLELQITSRAQAPNALTCLWDFLFEIRFPPLKLAAENIIIDDKPLQRQEVPEDRHFWFPASWEELRAAAHTGLLEIGSHMVSHVPLPWLSDSEKLFQMQHSRDELSRILGVQVKACAHPHGPVDDRTIAMAEKIYNWSFTNKPGRINVKTSRGAAPRYHVPGEMPGRVKWMLQWGQGISILRTIYSSTKNKINQHIGRNL